MSSRLDLHNKLVSILGTNNVYYQPPENLKMTYPCIRYNLTKVNAVKASDSVHILHPRYEIMLISTKNMDSLSVRILCEIPQTIMERVYISDGMYHYVYSHYE